MLSDRKSNENRVLYTESGEAKAKRDFSKRGYAICHMVRFALSMIYNDVCGKLQMRKQKRRRLSRTRSRVASSRAVFRADVDAFWRQIYLDPNDAGKMFMAHGNVSVEL